MGMFSFIKEAGEKLFGRGEAKAAQEAAAAKPTPENIEALSKAAGDAIATYINSMNLNVQALEIGFDAASATVTVSGVAPDQATKEKVLLCCGNVATVAAVNDLMTVSSPEPESQWHRSSAATTFPRSASSFTARPTSTRRFLRPTSPC